MGRIEYAPLRTLCRIPAEGRAVQAADVVAAISSLPKRSNGDAGDAWPYLEIRVEERQPEPTLMHDVTEALSDRAVHFCRMTRVLPEEKSSAAETVSPAASETLQQLSPLEVARRVFAARYKDEMPQELVERFKQAEAYNNED